MISERVKQVSPSQTLKITSQIKKLKKESRPVINFAAGEPDFDTPEEAKESAIKAIKSGFTKYTPVAGIPELREAIAEKFNKCNGLNYSPDQIVISNGAKHSIFNALLVLLNPGDEVIILSPYWVSYPEMVKLVGAKPVIVEMPKENGFRPDLDKIKESITSKTKCIILNSPTNPTGLVWEKEELEGLAEIILEKNLYLISDEIYEHLIYEGQHHSIASFSREIYQRTITVNGVSKTYSMTGWRIGWLAGPLDFVKEVIKVQGQMTSNPCSISQVAALGVLKIGGHWYEFIREEFKKRRDILMEELSSSGFKFIRPGGAFYLFLDISDFGMDSFKFAQQLLEKFHVGVIPGKPFGRDDFVRISYATSVDEIREGVRRLREFLNG